MVFTSVVAFRSGTLLFLFMLFVELVSRGRSVVAVMLPSILAEGWPMMTSKGVVVACGVAVDEI